MNTLTKEQERKQNIRESLTVKAKSMGYASTTEFKKANPRQFKRWLKYIGNMSTNRIAKTTANAKIRFNIA